MLVFENTAKLLQIGVYMSNYEQRVVFFLDFLGFKNIIDNNEFPIDDILKLFSETEYHLDYTKF